jgi:exosome complex component RRP45
MLTCYFPVRSSSQLVIDPTHSELLSSTGTLTLALNPQRELCVLSKAGGTPLSVDEVMRVVGVGAAKVRELWALVERRLKEDAEGRVIEVR